MNGEMDRDILMNTLSGEYAELCHLPGYFNRRTTRNTPACWLCCYMTQLNPLIGPKLSMNEIMIMAREWGNEIKNTMDVTV